MTSTDKEPGRAGVTQGATAIQETDGDVRATSGDAIDGNAHTTSERTERFDNIDEQGNVLYLDAERLRRKEQPDKPLWQNHPNGIGIKNFLVTHLSARDWNWKLVLALFRKLVKWSAFMREPDSRKSKLYKRAMYFDPAETMYSTGSIYNLNVDTACDHEQEKPGTRAFNDAVREANGTTAFAVAHGPAPSSSNAAAAQDEQAENVDERGPVATRHAQPHSHSASSQHHDERAHCDVLAQAHRASRSGATITLDEVVATDARKITVPMDLVKKAIREASFIGGMKECLCRAGNDCQTYPHDLACLFLNRAGQVVVDHGMAREFTVEEALARVDRAAELGLTCQSLFVEVEQLIWGFRNDEMDSFLEICFCCPCCCVALNLSNNATPDVKKRFSPSGWTAVVNHDACVGCQHCVDTYCPQDAIHFRESDGKMVVDQERCVGCGICRAHCPHGAISIKQTMPMRERMQDYFLEEGRISVRGTDAAGRDAKPYDPLLESATMSTARVASKAVGVVGETAVKASRQVIDPDAETGVAGAANEVTQTVEEVAQLANELHNDIIEKQDRDQ